LSFLGNKGVFECLRLEWPQSSEVCSFESALGFALGRSIEGVRWSPLHLSVCICGRSRGYWVPACAHESL